MIDLFGHIAYFLLFVGLIFLSFKKQIGWILRLTGELTWIILGFKLNLSSIVIWGIIFISIDIYGYWKWRDSG